MPGLGALWDSLVDCICRPPRDEYIFPDELVGGSRKLFRVGRYPGAREDLTLTNKRGMLLQCSHYFPKHVRGKDGRLPCVIYCHCNSGSRRDAEEAICVLIPCGVSVFTLDFAGSGLSEGQWVTLGAEEVDDVATVVEHLRSGGKISTLGLWGRSMGAVTALLYSQRDPSIAGMVLDSPFSRLTDLMLEIVQEQRLPIPRPLAKLALAAMKRSVNKRAGFDITKVSPVDAVSRSFIPALFGHATGDTFIRISHAEALHEAYAGDKNLIRFEGDHNSRRPEFFYNSVSIFWHNTLQLEHLVEPADPASSSTNTQNPSALGPQHAGASGASVGSTGSTGSSSGRPGAGRALRPPPARLRHPHSNPALSADPAAAGGGGAVAAAPNGAPATAGTAAGAGVDEEECVDVASMAARSAPWEPRIWEVEADKAAREKQRFRSSGHRMAGGLPSPSHRLDGAGGAAANGGPLGAAGATGGGITGGGRGSFRSSAELAQLFATTSDESLAARLLGEDPQWSDRPGATAASAASAAAAAAAASPLNGRLVSSLMAASMLLPETVEEEEAQLAAALQLSLMEAAAEEETPPPGAAAAAAPPPGERPGAATGIAGAAALGPGNARDAGAAQGEEMDGGVLAGATVLAATPSLIYPDAMVARPAQATTASAAGAAATAAEATTAADAADAPTVQAGRSSSHGDAAMVASLAAVMPSAALSGPSTSGQQAEAGACGAAVTALMDAVATSDVLGGQTAQSALSACDPAAGGAPPGPVPAGRSSAGAAGVAAAAAAAAARAAADGLSVYDLYTEDELMSLAVQLSLQESAATAAAAPAPSVNGAAAAGADGGAAAAAADGLPSLL